MPAGRFFDTNLIVYFAIQNAPHSGRAAELIEGGGTISVQVLNEFTNVARSRMRMSWDEVNDTLQLLQDLLDVQPLTIAVQHLGVALAERYNFHIYDAMIVAAALEADCDVLYSEDMQHGLVVEKRLRIVNPFV